MKKSNVDAFGSTEDCGMSTLAIIVVALCVLVLLGVIAF